MKTLFRWFVVALVVGVTLGFVHAFIGMFIGGFVRILLDMAYCYLMGRAISRSMRGQSESYAPQRMPQRTAPVEIAPDVLNQYWRDDSSDARLVPGQRVYGVPGGTLDDSDFDPEKIERGRKGEEWTAKNLERLAHRLPGVYVFNSLRWPGSKRADIDHVVLVNTSAGDLMFCIDSKNWERGDYAWDGRRTWLNGRPYYEIKMDAAVESMREKYRGTRVIGVVANFGVLSLAERGNPSIDMVAGRDLEAYIMSFLHGRDGQHEPNLTTATELLNQLKK